MSTPRGRPDNALGRHSGAERYDTHEGLFVRPSRLRNGVFLKRTPYCQSPLSVLAYYAAFNPDRRPFRMIDTSAEKYPGATLATRNVELPMSMLRLIHEMGTSSMS